jgi:hypothetical protein
LLSVAVTLSGEVKTVRMKLWGKRGTSSRQTGGNWSISFHRNHPLHSTVRSSIYLYKQNAFPSRVRNDSLPSPNVNHPTIA